MQLLVSKEDISDLSSRDLKELLAFLFRKEPVILSVMIEEAARKKADYSASLEAVKLMKLAMLPPKHVLEEVLNEILRNIVERISKKELLQVVDLVNGLVVENESVISDGRI